MKVLYLGTGASEGIPALFCNCDYCKRVRRGGGKMRSRAQVLLDGELSIDFPPDSFYHQAAFGVDLSAVRYLLVTHAHMDHFNAENFVMRGYKYALNMTQCYLDIYANAEVLKVFRQDTQREIRREVKNPISLHKLTAFHKAAFGDWQVFPLKAKHNSKSPLLYLIEKDGKRILHLTDTGLLPEEDYVFLKTLGGGAVDLITFDCTFLWEDVSISGRHMGLKENMQVLHRLEEIGLADAHTKKVVTHFSHYNQPTEENLKRAEEECGVIAAYDGLEIEI